MSHSYWPLFDLRLTFAANELLTMTEADLELLAAAATDPVAITGFEPCRALFAL